MIPFLKPLHFSFSPSIRFHLFALFLISLSIAFGYGRTLNDPFQLDDEAAFVHNPAVHIKELNPSTLFPLFSGNRPIPNLTFALNYYLGGFEPRGYHLANLLIHLITTYLVYLFFLKTLSLSDFESRLHPQSGISGKEISLIGALFWSLHPVQTESVTYIVQRMTSVGTLFYLLSLFAYINGRVGGGRLSWLWLMISILSYALALGSKENMVSLPVIILLYEFFFIRQFRFGMSRRTGAIFIVMSLLFLGGAAWIIKIHTGTVSNLSALLFERYGVEDFNPVIRVMTEWRVLIYYLSLLLFPDPGRMNLDYDFPLSRSLVDPVTTLFSLLTILALIGFACFRGKKYPIAAFSILWFFINLAIESSFINFDLVFEHRLYLPSIPFFLLSAAALYFAVSQLKSYRSEAMLGISMVIFLLLATGTRERNRVWETPISLWSDAATKSPEKGRVLNNLGEAYLEAGRLEEAKSTFKRVIRLEPKNQAALNALGYLYHAEGRTDEAIANFNAVLELNRNDPAAHLNLGVMLAELGRSEPALTEYREAARLKPDLIAAHLNAGILYSNTNRLDEALAEYRKVVELNPGYPAVHTNLGQIYFKKGRLNEAVSEFQHGIDSNPKEFIPYFDLGYALDTGGQKTEAVKYYEEALKWAQPSDRAEVETIHRRLTDLMKTKN